MRQLFFLPDKPFDFASIPGANFHVWTDDDGLSVGVVHMDGQCDAEAVIEWMEGQGFAWLPNHQTSEQIKHEHVQRLDKHGVIAGDTTAQAMTKVHTKSGFPPLKPKRF